MKTYFSRDSDFCNLNTEHLLGRQSRMDKDFGTNSKDNGYGGQTFPQF